MTVSALQATQASVTASGVRRCGRCECRLSRYNKDDYCTGCSRGMRPLLKVRPTVPAHVWHSDDVQRALLNRQFGELCSLIRRLGRLRQEDMAVMTGLSQAFLSMLESDVRRLTNIDKIVQLLAGLQAPMELTGPMLRPRIEHDAVTADVPAYPGA